MVIILSSAVKKIIIRVLTIAMGMEMLDASILNTSLPQIAFSLHIHPLALKTALTTYLLSLGIFIPVSGWMTDRIGEKNTLLLALIIFTLSSVGCGLSSNLVMMIVFRFLQGIGGAFLLPVGRLIIVRIFSGYASIEAMAKVVGTATLAMLLGPLIGGALTTYLQWRWIFFINIVPGLIGIYYVYYYFPTLRERIKTKFDILGFLLVGSGLGSLLFFCDLAMDPSISFFSKLTLLLFTFGTFIGYYFHARHHPAALINLGIFKQVIAMRIALGSFLSRLALGAQPFLLPLLLQAGYGYSAIYAGFFTIPLALAVMINKPLISPLVKCFDYKPLLLVNTAFLILLCSSYCIQTITFMPILLIFQQFLFGFCMSMQFTLMNSWTYQHIHEPYVSHGTSFYSGIIQISSSFSIALAALVMNITPNTPNPHQPIALLAFKVVFIVLAVYLCLAEWVFSRIKSQDLILEKIDLG